MRTPKMSPPSRSELMPNRQDRQNFLESLADATQVRTRAPRKRKGNLLLFALGLFAHLLAGAGDGIALFVQQALDPYHVLDVTPPVHALTGAAFDGFELGKFGFPEA